MTESAPYQPSTRRGRLVFWVLVGLVVAGIVAVIKVWPESLEERQDAAVDLCKTEVDAVEPTPWQKLWQESSFRIDGDKVITVSGKFATKDAGFRQFSCEVEDGKVTSSQIEPGK
ncbi:hypothetical protein JIG36_14130 [Actinoplanes sp. LDG1-06]|uniref:Uncharacterized protein n=1 Tax=Paractinoplanes ovalisporus TaxID=2810368 RepID=A0ABS2ABN7_9ACTN|nr:hypothetical protein [Actinoplanes ovalisporus]MBM2616699.1 hypothetical protein [Actinoplanes ovalisporus]